MGYLEFAFPCNIFFYTSLWSVRIYGIELKLSSMIRDIIWGISYDVAADSHHKQPVFTLSQMNPNIQTHAHIVCTHKSCIIILSACRVHSHAQWVVKRGIRVAPCPYPQLR